jgi:hypothetical protein
MAEAAGGSAEDTKSDGEPPTIPFVEPGADGGAVIAESMDRSEEPDAPVEDAPAASKEPAVQTSAANRSASAGAPTSILVVEGKMRVQRDPAAIVARDKVRREPRPLDDVPPLTRLPHSSWSRDGQALAADMCDVGKRRRLEKRRRRDAKLPQGEPARCAAIGVRCVVDWGLKPIYDCWVSLCSDFDVDMMRQSMTNHYSVQGESLDS